MVTGLFIQVNKMLAVSLDKGLRKVVVKLQLQPMLTSPFFAKVASVV